MGKLWAELKRRKVFRIAVIYTVVAWVLIQVADTVLPALQAPQWTVSFVTVLFFLGFLPTLIAAWAYEITPEGVRADTGIQVTQSAANSTDRKLIYAILVLVLLAVGFQVADRFVSDQASSSTPLAAVSSASSVMRSSILLDQSVTADSFGFSLFPTLSADGALLIYALNRNGESSQLWSLDLTTQQSRLLLEGAGTLYPRLSPDGQRLLISKPDEFIITSLQGAISRTLALPEKDFGPAGEWLSDEAILYQTTASIHRLSLISGEDEDLTGEAPGVQRSSHPLPSGNAFLFEHVVEATSVIEVYDLTDATVKPLLEDGYMPRYTASGHLVFIRSGDLWAAPFDAEALELLGPAVTVVAGVYSIPEFGQASYTFSASGRLVYLPGDEFIQGDQTGLSWSDRLGNTEEIPLPVGNYQQLELSPDGNSLALVSVEDDGSIDVWVYDLARETLGKRTFTGDARRPTWSPDGSRLFYQVEGNGIWQVNADGTGQAEQVYSSDTARPAAFSGNGDELLYLGGPIGGTDINRLTFADGTWLSTPLISSDANTWGAMVSPNGRWIAYSSTESGRAQIYLRPYPDIESGKWQVSNVSEGITREPQWSPSEDALYYLHQTESVGTLMSVSIDDADGISPGLGTPKPLLEGLLIIGNYPPNYGISNDGQRFLRFTPEEKVVSETTADGNGILTVVENWFEELERLAPH